MNTEQEIAFALLKIGAVGFIHGEPITFKSGLKAPVYVDNRKLPYHPAEWQKIIKGFMQIIEREKLEFDVIAGIETAGIPHSAALGFALEKPSVFVRKKVKDHGTKSKIEGGDVTQSRVILIEDHITTGGSSLAGVDALRESGATVSDCLSITSYQFEEAEQSFSEKKVRLHTLTTFPVMLEVAMENKIIAPELKQQVELWLADPWNWSKAHE